MTLPGGGSLGTDESTAFSFGISNNQGQLTITATSANTELLGTRNYRIIAQLGTTNTVNVYMQVIVGQPDSNLPILPMDVYNAAICQHDKIYPFLLGYAGFDVNVTFSNMDAYGNLMLAGWGSKVPFGFGNATQLGYLALLDQFGQPYWVYTVRDNTFFGNTYCTYISHFKHSTLTTTDYTFALCNIPRFDLTTPAAQYSQSPVILKLYHNSGQLIYMRHLPIDPYGNVMPQSGLYASMIDNTATGYAIYRYRYQVLTTSFVQTFAAIQFTESSFSVNYFNVYPSPDPTAGGLTSQASPKSTGWYSTYVMSDSSAIYTVVYGDALLGTLLYSY